jgi:transposase
LEGPVHGSGCPAGGFGVVGSVIVHDRYQNYDSAVPGELIHPLCRQHLLRDDGLSRAVTEQPRPAHLKVKNLLH